MLARLLGRYPFAKLLVLLYAVSWIVSIYTDDVDRPGLGTRLPPGARKFLALFAVVAVARGVWVALDGRRRGAAGDAPGDTAGAGRGGVRAAGGALGQPATAAAGRGGSLGRVALGVVGALVVMYAVSLLVQLLAAASGLADAWVAAD
jgi:hypothetical protein